MRVIKLGASWCNPCSILSKNLEGFDRCELEEIDISENPEEMEKYGVRNIPTLIIVDSDGKVLNKRSGVISKDELNRMIDNVDKNRNS